MKHCDVTCNIDVTQKRTNIVIRSMGYKIWIVSVFACVLALITVVEKNLQIHFLFRYIYQNDPSISGYKKSFFQIFIGFDIFNLLKSQSKLEIIDTD